MLANNRYCLCSFPVQGRCYVGGFGYNVDVGDPPVATGIALVQPDGTVSAQAKDLLIFPNGIVISEDGKTLIVAEVSSLVSLV